MSYEKEVMEKMSRGESTGDRLEIPILKYLWDASPLSFLAKESYHDFFKKVSVLNSFSDNEVRLFTKFLHRREFMTNEVIFKQGDSGYGFYFIFSGSVNIHANFGTQTEDMGDFVIRLEKRQYFGEMGLLEEFNRRSATVVAAENTVLLGIFKPDLERMLELYPVLGAKFLRETALIMANRMGQLTREIVMLKKKVKELEQRG
ncbi:cyclic nucleotide-binding domain-containing protein [Peredibacter starrii]|uniref:Cyclic nucleotide-binding domain-containing protein n=1 Tax=Peredibacter starrii TaxID=28202 RepID=A0AAX4HPT6_9BACT|nr:cyclic nucleotide-binding domain-containing protein [Peredibacter starrii]WPU65302.1 cyclic nucleotide-binding domain-containing protein [Peredibacter starrii]